MNIEKFYANGEHLITNAEARVRDKEHKLNYLKDYVASLEINQEIADSREETDSES